MKWHNSKNSTHFTIRIKITCYLISFASLLFCPLETPCYFAISAIMLFLSEGEIVPCTVLFYAIMLFLIYIYFFCAMTSVPVTVPKLHGPS